MTYTSDQVFEQALEDRFASNVDGRGYEGRISYGTKITRDNATGEVEFFNTTKGGSHYVKLSPAEEHIFYSKGWKYEACCRAGQRQTHRPPPRPFDQGRRGCAGRVGSGRIHFQDR